MRSASRPMPTWWVQKRAAARLKKEARCSVSNEAGWSNEPGWSYHPQPEPAPQASVPYDPHPNPHSWYQFCTDRKYAYDSRNEPIAAMVYWALRAFDYEKDLDPCTDEGYRALCGYWEYKMDWYESRSKG